MARDEGAGGRAVGAASRASSTTFTGDAGRAWARRGDRGLDGVRGARPSARRRRRGSASRRPSPRRARDAELVAARHLELHLDTLNRQDAETRTLWVGRLHRSRR